MMCERMRRAEAPLAWLQLPDDLTIGALASHNIHQQVDTTSTLGQATAGECNQDP
jgi:hypothetical protein